MYDPVKDGVDKSVESVAYVEARPPAALDQIVHCVWELRTETDLVDDFVLHALPDACVNLLFDQRDTRIAGVTRLATRHTQLGLGRSFHYVGVQLYPGVWRGGRDAPVDHYIGEPYEGELPLTEVGRAVAEVDFDVKVELLCEFVGTLVDEGVVAPNPITAAILANLDRIDSVGDMAAVAALSPRQLQRTLKTTTGLTPHDLLKVLRLQQSFRHDYRWWFADQSHFTHSFRAMTGYTPGRFGARFDV